MNSLPVILRELRVRARKRGMWLRPGVAGGLFFLVLYALDSNPNLDGHELLENLSWWLYAFALVAGTWTTSDALSQERREGTLELLLLTNLGTMDIVLGKLVAHSLQAVFILVGAVPVLALTLVMGGVTFALFSQVVLVLGVTLWLSLAMGLFFSAMFRSAQQAFGWTFFILLLVGALLPVVGANLVYFGRATLGEVLQMLSPGPLLSRSLSGVILPGEVIRLSLAFLIGGGVVIALAGCVLRLTWQRPDGRSRLGRGVTMLRWLAGARALRRFDRWNQGRKLGLLEKLPYSWVSGRRLGRDASLWLLLLAVAVTWLICYLKWPEEMVSASMCWMMSFFFHCLLKVHLAGSASIRLAEDRRSGVLELLISTELDPPAILKGEAYALFRTYRYPLLFVWLIDLMALSGFISEVSIESTIGGMYFFQYLMSMIFLVVDLAVMAMIAMWVGLRSGKSTRATVSALFWVLVFPGLLMFLFLLGGGVGEEVFILWAFVSAIVNAVCYALAHGSFLQRFREVVTSPLGWKPSSGEANH